MHINAVIRRTDFCCCALFADLYWGSRKGLATAMLQTIQSSRWTLWVWFARILFWKAEKGTPDAVGGFLGTDHVMSVYHTPWTRLFPLKPFDTSDVPPFTGQSRDDGLLPSLSHVVLFFLCAHRGFGRDYSSHTVSSVFITEILHDFAFFPPLKTFKNLVHEFAEHQAEVWPPRCNTNTETVRNGPKYSCMFRKTFRQLVESYRCH